MYQPAQHWHVRWDGDGMGWDCDGWWGWWGRFVICSMMEGKKILCRIEGEYAGTKKHSHEAGKKRIQRREGEFEHEKSRCFTTFPDSHVLKYRAIGRLMSCLPTIHSSSPRPIHQTSQPLCFFFPLPRGGVHKWQERVRGADQGV